MIDLHAFITILGMAAVTYSTRLAGFMLLRNRQLGTRAQRVMETAPGCVFISIIAPVFVSSEPATLLGLAVTILAALRFSMLPTVVSGVTATGLFRLLLG